MDVKERMGYIGASDCAAVLGLSRWSSPLNVWAEKTGMVEPEDISGKLPVKLGIRLEEAVAELFEEETGKSVHRVNEAYSHPKHDFLKVHIDRKVEGERSYLECKTCSAWKAKEWDGEEIPQEYILQGYHGLAVTGYDKVYVAVLVGNQDFKVKELERDDKIISDIVAREVEFWTKYIEPKVMPQIITKNDTDVLYRLFPNATQGQEISLGDAANQVIESLEAIGQDINALMGQRDKLKNELKAMMKESEIGNTGIYKVTWKNVTKKEFIMPATNYRELRHRRITTKEG